MVACLTCAHENPGHTKFCRNCGNVVDAPPKVRAEPEPVVEPEPEVPPAAELPAEPVVADAAGATSEPSEPDDLLISSAPEVRSGLGPELMDPEPPSDEALVPTHDDEFSPEPATPVVSDPELTWATERPSARSPAAPLAAPITGNGVQVTAGEGQRKPDRRVLFGALTGVAVVALLFTLSLQGGDKDWTEAFESGEDATPVVTTESTLPQSTALPVTVPPVTVPPTTVPPTTAPPTTAPPTTVPPTTVPPTTVPPTTVPPTTVPPTTVPDPAAIRQIPAGPPPLEAAGVSQVLSNPLPSGVVYADVEGLLVRAQQLADSLALNDWAAVRLIDPATAEFSDQRFEDGYRNLNRASLILLDARPTGIGYDLLVVSAAIELDGTQTSLYCLTWGVDAQFGTVSQRSGSLITFWPGNTHPEAIPADAAALEQLARCTWG
jgi:hypothetical protein